MALTKLLKLMLSCMLCLVLADQNAASQVVLQPPTSVVPKTMFGMHIHGMAIPRPSMHNPDPWPTVPFATWRLWDAYVAWPNLEPRKGEWHFENLDKYLGQAQLHNVEILLPLGLSPSWASARPGEKSAGIAAEPKNIDDWRTYVRTVASHCKGKVHYYEIWNEPNLKDFFSGSPQQMAVLTQEAAKILKEVDPTNKVISPSATGGGNGLTWLDQFLKSGGGGYVDIIGYHFYVTPNPPEEMVSLIAKVRDVIQKHGLGHLQVWNTESGWRIANHNTEVKSIGSGFSSNVLSDSDASAYLARANVLSWAAGVSRFYWYAWDNGVMGLTEADGATIKPPAVAYGEVENWLVGSRFTSCGSDVTGTWNCALVRDGGYKGWILWNPTRSLAFQIPQPWGVKRARLLSGQSHAMTNPKSVDIGPMPLLLENRLR